MHLRLQVNDVNLVYRCGKFKNMELADTLSRAYLPYEEPTEFETQVAAVNMADSLPIAAARLEDIKTSVENDDSMQMLKQAVLKGWPERRDEVPKEITQYFCIRDELSVQEGIIYRGERVVIPRCLRRDMVQRIHSAHIGVEGCLRRARECLYWPGMTREIKDHAAQCEICRAYDNRQQKETLHSHQVPDRPWAKVGVDLFKFNGRNYLIVVDYFSGFWEIDPLESTTVKPVIRKMKTQFSRYGIPDVCVSDNGPQFQAEEYKKFSREWMFQRVTSSPGYPKSNGRVENAVQAAKRLMKKAKKDGSDAYLAVLDYRNTPSQGMETSPSQRLMSRRTKTLLPTTAELLKPRVVENQHEKIKENRARQAKYYNKGAKDLPLLQEGDVVRIQGKDQVLKKESSMKAKVESVLGKRSYEVITEDGKRLRRNRVHLRKTKESYNPVLTGGDDSDSTDSGLMDGDNLLENPSHSMESHVTEGRVQESRIEQSPVPVRECQSETTTSSAEVPQIPVDVQEVIRTRSGRQVKRPQYLKDYLSHIY